MPLISNYNKKKESPKHFQKKTYRPWDEDLFISDSNKIFDNTINDADTSNPNHSNDKNNNGITPQVKDSKKKIPISDFEYKKELRNLFGAQRIILKYLLKQIEEDYDEYVITKAIYMSALIEACKLSANTIKGTIQTLKSRKFFETYENKQGRGGYARYKFNKEIHTFFSNNLTSTMDKDT